MMLGTARRRCSLRLCQATPRWINQACASSARGLCGKPEEAKWFLENTDVPDDPRTVRFLQLAKEHGASEMRDCIDKQLAFSAVPTTMIGSGAMAALIGLNLGSGGSFASSDPLLAQAVVGLLGASTCSSIFFLAHANTLFAGLQYSGRGASTLSYVRQHGWRFSTLVRSAVATQVCAMGGLLLYVWTPALAPTGGLLHWSVPAALSLGASLGVLRQAQLFLNLSVAQWQAQEGGERESESSARAAASSTMPPPPPPPHVCIPGVDGVPPPGAFSRAVVHNGFVYVSGTGASNDTATGAVRTTSAFDETRGALDNISAVLEAAGSSAERIVVATMLLTDKQDYSECNRAYVRFFAELGLADRLPARSSALWAVPTTAKVAFSVVATVAPRTCTADSK